MWYESKAFKRTAEKRKRMNKRLPKPWLQVYQAKQKGIKFGKLSPVRMCGINRNGVWLWLCQCDCGGQRKVSSISLVSKKVTSCGCLCKLNRQNMATFFTPAFCRQCGTTYTTNKYRKTRQLCPLCSHRLSAKQWAAKNRKKLLPKTESK